MAHPCQNTAPDPVKRESDDLQLKVDFFRKLGYSSKDVKSVLRKLGPDPDTNAALGELVRIGARPAPHVTNSDNNEKSAWSKYSLMPSSWTSGTSQNIPEAVQKKPTDEELRPIVIDGSNVAMSHGNKETFSCRGIQLAVNFFLDRGHNNIKVFVPSWRKEQPRPDAPIRDQKILTDLENRGILVFTPSRRVGGKLVVCYDDRYIVEVAAESEAVIVSNDTYRDLQGENSEWKKCIEERLLMYSFVNDRFMPPDDPLGRHGPNLDNYLRKKPLPTEPKRQPCPYDKKCTYGIKCKYYHPERTKQSYRHVADELRDKAQISSNEPCSQSSPTLYLGETESVKSFPGGDNLAFRDSSWSGHSEEHSQSEWAGQHHYYVNGSQEYLDSGLGSYDSHSNSPWPWPQTQSSGSRHASMQEKNNTSQLSHYYTPHISTGQQPARHMEGQPKYNSYPYPCSVPNKGSLHIPFQYNSAPHYEQNYFSDPYGMSLSKAAASATTHHNRLYNYPQYSPWAQPTTRDEGDQDRMEPRSLLKAIFHPKDVDEVMKMFPDLTDPEKLAVEIVKVNAQRGLSHNK
ncbi:unnamed protein product [Knipowitschia caucasica]